MKINNLSNAESVVNSNSRGQVDNKDGVQQEQKARVKNGNLKASELNLLQDPIEEKKKKAKEEAMDFIKKQFASDGMISDVMDEFRSEIASSKDEATEAAQELGAIRKEMEELKEEYGDATDDSDYQARMKALSEEAGEWQKQYDQAHKVIAAATGGIKGIKQESLKYHGMVDATKLAEESLKASSDEIVGMLKDEAMEKIDQDLDDVVEEAKDKKEENVKEEAQKEEARLEREKHAQEAEEQVQERIEKEKRTYVPSTRKLQSQEISADMSEMMRKQQEVLQNTQQILEEQKLLQEEIKGIAIDSLL